MGIFFHIKSWSSARGEGGGKKDFIGIFCLGTKYFIEAVRMSLRTFLVFSSANISKSSKFSSLAPSALAKLQWISFGWRRGEKQPFAALCDWHNREMHVIHSNFGTF